MAACSTGWTRCALPRRSSFIWCAIGGRERCYGGLANVLALAGCTPLPAPGSHLNYTVHPALQASHGLAHRRAGQTHHPVFGDNASGINHRDEDQDVVHDGSLFYLMSHRRHNQILCQIQVYTVGIFQTLTTVPFLIGLRMWTDKTDCTFPKVIYGGR